VNSVLQGGVLVQVAMNTFLSKDMKYTDLIYTCFLARETGGAFHIKYLSSILANMFQSGPR
jgi:hypothetical protein